MLTILLGGGNRTIPTTRNDFSLLQFLPASKKAEVNGRKM